MRALMGVIKDRHGTYYARKKVPKGLEEAVARVLANGKQRQSWLKRSLGTKSLHEANIRARRHARQIREKFQDEVPPSPNAPPYGLTDEEFERIGRAYRKELKEAQWA